jgi:hypothetical protein
MSTYDPSVFSPECYPRVTTWSGCLSRAERVPGRRFVHQSGLRENRANAGFAVFQGNTFALAVPDATPVIGSVCA